MSLLMNFGTCCMVLSFWAIIQLVLMGIFFKVETVALLNSVGAKEYENADDYIKLTKKNYNIVAVNCFIAAGMYLVMAGISILCIRYARRAEKKRVEMLEDDDISCRPLKKKVKSKPKLK
ncbi:hypothetical protein K1T71_010204 [Dendrolimus kikuchii]|uniref:Uncharacterized protein n=1 Tax=Dendrolimus kikuchii TaxID=765133 RepID=A0ACC1CR77_9NEOP|nr:hypothetical protein K1T71_010204 [Dendrolimus kikuchii]